MEKIQTITVNGSTYTIEDPDAARINDSRVGGDAWSSRQILDRLCPAFSESAAAVTCRPVEGYPLKVVSRIEPVPDAGTQRIPGHTGVTLYRGGKNLARIKCFSAVKPSQTSAGSLSNKHGTTISATTADRITVTQSSTNEPNSFGHYSNGYFYIGFYGLLRPGDTVTVSFDYERTSNPLNTGGTTIFLQEQLVGQPWPAAGTNRYDMTFTVTEQTASVDGWNVLEIRIWGKSGVFSNFQIEFGSAATEHEPSRGEFLTADFGQRVYGGSYDWESGVLTVTHGNIDAYADEKVPEGWISGTGQLSEGAQVVYPLAEPVTAQLTPRGIPALSGTNCLFGTAGDTQVTGRLDPVPLLQQLTGQL